MDHKTELLQSISNALVRIVDTETASLIQDVILVKLNDYDVERRTTALRYSHSRTPFSPDTCNGSGAQRYADTGD